MDVRKVPLDDPDWREFVSAHPSAGPFHLPTWAALLAACYRFEAFALVVCGGAGEIVGGLPIVAVRLPLGRLRWVSLPFSDYCPMLARPDVSVEDAIRALSEHARAGGVYDLEIRSALPARADLHPFDAGYRHALRLPTDAADLHPHRNFRQHRNQAAKAGIQVTRGTAAADIDAFYRLHTLTRRRLGVPVQPRRLFNLISDRMFAEGHGFVATATQGGEAVATCLYLMHNGTMVAKYAATDPTRPETGAAHLIHWETMSAACGDGYHTYDLGRSDPAAEGLRTYKSRMGAEELPLVYTHTAPQRPSGRRGTIGDLSERVISHSPAWVCRALGEVLYRWTA